MSIIGPVVFLMLIGIMEFGLFFRDYVSTANAAGSGAQAGSVAGDRDEADLLIVREVQRSLGGVDRDLVQRVVIYNARDAATNLADAPAASAEANCRNGIAVADLCNVFDTSVILSDLTDPAFQTQFECGGADRSRHWCPADRDTGRENGTDLVGVLVVMNHNSITGIGPSNTVIMEDAVLQLEAQDFDDA